MAGFPMGSNADDSMLGYKGVAYKAKIAFFDCTIGDGRGVSIPSNLITDYFAPVFSAGL